jgi:transposase-like protein
MKQRRKQRQSIPGYQRYTFKDFDTELPDDEACLRFIAEQRWPDCRTMCEKCKVERKHYPVTGRKAFACDHCGNHIYPMAGSIFEKSTTSLRTWFHAMYLMGQTRCGISAKQIQRETGVTYKTAWRIFRQVRTLMSEDIRLEGSSVEMDESVFGGRQKGQHGRVTKGNKSIVVGIAERKGKGRVVAMIANDATRATLHGIAQEKILPASTVYTDDYSAYHGLGAKGYQHRRINHSAGVYVMGDIHTQTIEGFWSLVKRGIGGVYHSVSKKYLQSYLDEYSFRYNRRAPVSPAGGSGSTSWEAPAASGFPS